MTYAVEAAGTPRAGGTVLYVTTGHLRPDNVFCSDPVPVLPSQVAAGIRAALADGWQPAAPGSAFQLTEPEGPCTARPGAQPRTERSAASRRSTSASSL